MNSSDGCRAGWAARLALAALAAVAITLPIAPGAEAQSPGEQCAKTLEKQYGAAVVGGEIADKKRERRSLYTDATLPDGQTVRFRCLVRKGGIHDVQVYTPPAMGSADPGWNWTSAAALGAAPGAVADDTEPTTQAKAPAEPEQAAPPAPQPGVRKQAPKP